MKSLKEYINESMFDEEDIETNVIDSEIIDWIVKNHISIKPNYLTISKKPNKDGKYVVDYKYSVLIKSASMVSLTNDMFVWGEVKGNFDCSYCDLTSLEGAPKIVKKTFHCVDCNSLTSLEGAPEKVGRDFNCNDCNSLISLEGAPKEVEGVFNCSGCKSLTSLAGIPKKIGGKIKYRGCAKYFTEADIEKAQNA